MIVRTRRAFVSKPCTRCERASSNSNHDNANQPHSPTHPTITLLPPRQPNPPNSLLPPLYIPTAPIVKDFWKEKITLSAYSAAAISLSPIATSPELKDSLFQVAGGGCAGFSPPLRLSFDESFIPPTKKKKNKIK